MRDNELEASRQVHGLRFLRMVVQYISAAMLVHFQRQSSHHELAEADMPADSLELSVQIQICTYLSIRQWITTMLRAWSYHRHFIVVGKKISKNM